MKERDFQNFKSDVLKPTANFMAIPERRFQNFQKATNEKFTLDDRLKNTNSVRMRRERLVKELYKMWKGLD